MQEDQKFKASLVYLVSSNLKTKTKPEVQCGKVVQFVTGQYYWSQLDFYFVWQIQH